MKWIIHVVCVAVMVSRTCKLAVAGEWVTTQVDDAYYLGLKQAYILGRCGRWSGRMAGAASTRPLRAA